MPSSIRQLHATDIGRIEEHLLRLSPDDRSLRFAAGVVTDESVRRYVVGIRFDTDTLLGVEEDEGGKLVGLAHGCVYAVGQETRVEVAFSVDAERRREGLGAALMAEARRFAESIGAHSVVGMCVARNLPMRHLFARASMAMTREDDEVHARCELASGNVQALPQSALAA
jgi:GNAT superfamily N-acetyltransferase